MDRWYILVLGIAVFASALSIILLISLYSFEAKMDQNWNVQIAMDQKFANNFIVIQKAYNHEPINNMTYYTQFP